MLDESPALMTSLGSDKSTTLSMVGSDDIDLVTMNEVRIKGVNSRRNSI